MTLTILLQLHVASIIDPEDGRVLRTRQTGSMHASSLSECRPVLHDILSRVYGKRKSVLQYNGNHNGQLREIFHAYLILEEKKQVLELCRTF